MWFLRRLAVATAALALAALAWAAWLRFHRTTVHTDVLVVGAGIGGLSAAYEAGYGGAQVAVAEMSSVFGGNALLSEGGLCIVDTPLQHEQGVQDSARTAEIDMLSWGEDADPEWAWTYVRTSRREIWDWLTGMGVRFTALRPQAGNHAPRFHENAERGLGLVRPIARACLRNPRIRFYWNTRIDRLITVGGAVTGAEGVNLRTGGPVRFEARAVVLATGGFQGNESLVRRHWPADLPQPQRLLLGATPNSSGAGLLMGIEAGGATHRLDHQWHYPFGVPDPRLTEENRAVSVRNLNAIWVNQQGERFVNEWMASRYTVEAVKRQKPATYWLVFDAPGVDDLRYSGTDWADLKLARRLLVDNPKITRRADTWRTLAIESGLPPERLEATVERYNRMVAQGADTDFRRFGPGELPKWLQVFPPPPPRALLTPPFYAMQAFPMTRKNMGGLRIDRNCQVLGEGDIPVAGLFAAGEVAGLGGVNGKAGLEGTFLGPSLVQGRRAGRFLAAQLRAGAAPSAPDLANAAAAVATTPSTSDLVCRACHGLAIRFLPGRAGFRHFGRAHRMAQERGYACGRCHGEVGLLPWRHRTDRLAATEHCGACHLPRK
jgi:succinate dehydrogenase/fumarate reductase flavoprotein subunit